MRIRAPYISASIARAIISDKHLHHASLLVSLYMRVLAFFRFFNLILARYRPADFLALRSRTWRIDEDEYVESFTAAEDEHNDRDSHQLRTRPNQRKQIAELIPVGDLGYSGSTFFTTPNGRYLVKSLPRYFEHAFFTHVLLDPYRKHMTEHPESLLVRITDMPYSALPSLGALLGTAPTHHIVMENLLHGEDDWETFDLKPDDYFFPERDIADGRLAPDSVIDNLVDRMPRKAVVSGEARRQLVEILERDTQLLADHNAVDYSLFLARRRREGQPTPGDQDWRVGVDDVEAGWTYRAVVLDFFWTKSSLHAKAMSGLVDAFNVIANQGPMSITADPVEYRQRFLRMVNSLIVAGEQSQ